MLTLFSFMRWTFALVTPYKGQERSGSVLLTLKAPYSQNRRLARTYPFDHELRHTYGERRDERKVVAIGNDYKR